MFDWMKDYLPDWAKEAAGYPTGPTGPEDIQFAPATPLVEDIRPGFLPSLKGKPFPLWTLGLGALALIGGVLFFWSKR